MNQQVFNAALLIGWAMVILGLGLWSVPAALVVGGALLMGVTLTLAFRAGVKPTPTKD
jgi:hypothetical protein